MPTLLLLRHAKAIGHGQVEDHARTLAPRGRAEATRLGHYFAKMQIEPDLALVSSAARTRETFEGVAAAAGRRPTVRIEDALYNATATQIRDMLRLVAPDVRTLLVVGHNPGIQEAAALLTREADPHDVQRLRTHFPPCALAVLVFDVPDWPEARARGGRLDRVLLPDDLPAAD